MKGAQMQDEEFFGYHPSDNEMVWEPWKKKFAILPKKLPNGKVWFKSYYERNGGNLYIRYIQRGTFLDVIKAEQ